VSHSWIQSVRGYVLVEVRGRGLEQLINRMIQQRMYVRDIRYTAEDRAEMNVVVGDFFRMRPLLKETGCRIHVVKRFGLPFLLDKLEKRKFFVVGLAGFIVGLYLLTSLVWQVRVEGNERISTDAVLQAARSEGVYKLQWKFRLPDEEQLARKLQSRLPGTAWIGVEMRGTHVVIKLVEATVPETKPLLSPRNLVAAKSGLVTKIIAEKGRPVVRPNTYVRQGDVLISGVLGDEQNSQTVVASGEVRGIVWYAPKIEVPLTLQYKVYTGEQKKRFYLVFGNRALQVTGYGKLAFEQFEAIQERKALQWRNYRLPLGWISEKVLETRMAEQPLDPAEARAIGLERAKSEILAVAGEGARVVGEKILHEKTENGKVYMEVHLEVEESIAAEQPIVPQP